MAFRVNAQSNRIASRAGVAGGVKVVASSLNLNSARGARLLQSPLLLRDSLFLSRLLQLFTTSLKQCVIQIKKKFLKRLGAHVHLPLTVMEPR